MVMKTTRPTATIRRDRKRYPTLNLCIQTPWSYRMQIDRLTIRNFCGFEFCELKFDPHFNLLVGDNATGKTSVLDALAIAVGSWFLGIKGYAKAIEIGRAH